MTVTDTAFRRPDSPDGCKLSRGCGRVAELRPDRDGMPWRVLRAANLGRASGSCSDRVEPIACMGDGYRWEPAVRAGLKSAGWASRAPLEELVHERRWAPAASAPVAVVCWVERSVTGGSA